MAEPSTSPDITEITRALAALVAPGAVLEIRVPKTGRAGTVSGYFDNLNTAAKAAASWSGMAPGVYFTLNPVIAALLARSCNRMNRWAEHTTGDAEIASRRWLFIDVDAVRPSGIASTDAEHAVALDRAHRIRDFLVDQGVPVSSIVMADSGNGGALYVRVDLPNDSGALAAVRAVLEALHALFSDAVATVDRSVCNAARISRVPGTLNAKGDPIADRRHRMARLLDVPAIIGVCPRDVVQGVAALAPQPERQAKKQEARRSYSPLGLDLEAWLAASGLEVSRVRSWGQAQVFELAACPWNADHKRTARIVRFDSGALSAGCFHDSCHGKTWADLRVLVGGAAPPAVGWRRGNPVLPTIEVGP